MERVAFLIEKTGQRLGCLLNPESLVVQRLAGVQPRRSTGGRLTGAALADDPLLFTGGGRTELQLDLLFDISVAGSNIQTQDVRDLTAPLWDLAENALDEEGRASPPLARFVWGKSWNVPGIVAAIAERLEYFTPGGEPRRSWLRMRFLRVADPTPRARQSQPPRMILPDSPEDVEVSAEQIRIHEVVGETGAVAGERTLTERLDVVAHRFYGAPSFWRVIAAYNRIADPLDITPGRQLQIPPLPGQEAGR